MFTILAGEAMTVKVGCAEEFNEDCGADWVPAINGKSGFNVGGESGG